MFGSQKIPVYCHMGNFGCGGGEWTLAIKIDGKKVSDRASFSQQSTEFFANRIDIYFRHLLQSTPLPTYTDLVLRAFFCGCARAANSLFFLFLFQKTFHYDSALCSNKNAHNLPGGKTGFDFEETKLPTYWHTSFSKICLGMKIPGRLRIKFLVINKQAQSLYSLIADGKYRSTSLSRNKWKTLIGSQASLQDNCNRKGFNAASVGHSRARIGIIGSNENDCLTPDSRIGFGNGGYHDNLNTCGNFAADDVNSDNGGKYIIALGYILVQ